MRFIKDGEIYKIIWISGPRHNLLCLVFSDQNIEDDKIEVIALTSKINHSTRVDPLEVKEQVISGMKEINNQLNTDYKLKQIQFVPSDTPSTDIYKELTKEIIKRLATGGKFE